MNGKSEAHDFEPIFTATDSIPNASSSLASTATEPEYRRIYIDLPGMGGTPAHAIHDLDEFFHRIVSFVDARLDSAAHFLLIGTSCGGYLARALARHYRSRVSGLLLRVPLVEPDNQKRDLDPFVPIVRDDAFMADVLAQLPSEEEDGGGDGESSLRDILSANVLVQTAEHVGALRRKYEDVFLPAMRGVDAHALGPIRTDPLRYRLTVPLEESETEIESSKSIQFQFPAPTLIVAGRQDGTVGYRDALRLLQWYPRATFAVLDRADHDLPVGEEQKRVLEGLVHEWLRRVEEWTGQPGGRHGEQWRS